MHGRLLRATHLYKDPEILLADQQLQDPLRILQYDEHKATTILITLRSRAALGHLNVAQSLLDRRRQVQPQSKPLLQQEPSSIRLAWPPICHMLVHGLGILGRPRHNEDRFLAPLVLHIVTNETLSSAAFPDQALLDAVHQLHTAIMDGQALLDTLLEMLPPYFHPPPHR